MRSDRAALLFALILCLAPAAGLQAQNLSGGEIRVNQQTAGMQWVPKVATAADGRFVVVWNQTGEDANFVTARRFGADGRPLGPEAPAVAGTEEQSSGRVATANGRFVVVCQSYTDGAFFSILARLFASSGAPLGEELTVSDDPYQVSQFEPAVAMAADGRFAVTWTDQAGDFDRSPDFNDLRGVMARFYAADGTPLGSQRHVNAFLLGSQESDGDSARLSYSTVGAAVPLLSLRDTLEEVGLF